jgi:Meiotically Up-regulated Gene 113 (MUG113) protein
MHVYVIQESQGPIKIGFSRNPTRRLADLQAATAKPLFLRHTIFATNGPRIEKGAHAILDHKKVNGEWFDATVDEGIAAIQEAKKFATRGQSIKRHPTMSSEQYRAALDTVGLNQVTAGKCLGISLRTSQNYATGKAEIPLAVASLLRLMVLWQLKPEDVPAD